MGRTVLLLHQLPDGSSHFDWLTERPGSGRLVSFRLRERIDGPGYGRFEAEAMPDHRRAYLEYEGPVSGGRGSVRRVAAGAADLASISPDNVVVVVDFGAGRQRAVGTRVGNAKTAGPADDGPVRWMFTITPLEPGAPAR